MIYLCSFAIVFVVSFLFLPFWYTEYATYVSLIQAAANIFILPAVLVAFNTLLFLKGKIRSFSALYLIVPLAFLTSEIFTYCNWGISTGGLLQPDGETIGLLLFFSSIGFGTSLLFLSMTHMTLKIVRTKMVIKQKIFLWIGSTTLIGIIALIYGMIIYKIF